MNEKIKLLCREKSDYWMNHYDRKSKADMELLYQDIEKFAELIVKECAEQIIETGTDWVDFAPSQTGVRPEYWAMAQQIKQHFGVGE